MLGHPPKPAYSPDGQPRGGGDPGAAPQGGAAGGDRLAGTERCTLLSHDGELARSERRTVHHLQFELKRPARAIGVLLDYQPRQLGGSTRRGALVAGALAQQLDAARGAGVRLERCPTQSREMLAQRAERAPLRNLLNLVLVDPTGAFRGRWDRNLAGQAVAEELVGEDWASRGFVAGPLAPGRWRASIEVHEIVTEQCAYSLRIVGYHDSETIADADDRRGPQERATPPDGAPPDRPPMRARQRTARHRPRPAQREYHAPLPDGWLRGELHTHTTASDGVYEPEELVERALALGLSFLAITDHNTVDGALSLADAPLPIVVGCEITTFFGHFPVYGIDCAPHWYDDQGRVLGPRDLAPALRGSGALFSIAHPYVLGNPVCCGCRLDAELEPAQLDMFEVWTRGFSDPIADLHALRRVDQLRTAGYPVVAVAGRDWHGASQEAAHTGLRYPATVVRAPTDREAITGALRRGAAYLSVGPHVEFRLRWADAVAELGETLAIDGADPETELLADIALPALDEPAVLRVVAGGQPAVQLPVAAGKPVSLQHPVPTGSGGARLELWDEQRHPLVLTNPIATADAPARTAT